MGDRHISRIYTAGFELSLRTSQFAIRIQFLARQNSVNIRKMRSEIS